MLKSTLYFIVFLFSLMVFFSCGKETSDALLSFNQVAIEENGNNYNKGCLDCNFFTWCDNSKFTYTPYTRGAATTPFTHTYKNVGIRRVGGYDFTATFVGGRDTIYHNCQNNTTRLLGADRSFYLTILKGDGVIGDTWTDTYHGGDTVINYKITGIDAPVVIGSKTYVSTIVVMEEKYFKSGNSQTLITKTENTYSRDRINSVRTAGVGLIKQEVKNPNNESLYSRILNEYYVP